MHHSEDPYGSSLLPRPAIVRIGDGGKIGRKEVRRVTDKEIILEALAEMIANVGRMARAMAIDQLMNDLLIVKGGSVVLADAYETLDGLAALAAAWWEKIIRLEQDRNDSESNAVKRFMEDKAARTVGPAERPLLVLYKVIQGRYGNEDTIAGTCKALEREVPWATEQFVSDLVKLKESGSLYVKP